MAKKFSRTEAKEKIEKFFFDIKNKKPEEVWKIKKLAMKQRISLGNKKQTFCKKCLKPFIEPLIRIKSGYKTISCKNCGDLKRIKLS